MHLTDVYCDKYSLWSTRGTSLDVPRLQSRLGKSGLSRTYLNPDLYHCEAMHTTLSLVHNVREEGTKRNRRLYFFYRSKNVVTYQHRASGIIYVSFFSPFESFRWAAVLFTKEVSYNERVAWISQTPSGLYVRRVVISFPIHTVSKNSLRVIFYVDLIKHDTDQSPEPSFRPPLSLFPNCLGRGECFKNIINKRNMIVNLLCYVNVIKKNKNIVKN